MAKLNIGKVSKIKDAVENRAIDLVDAFERYKAELKLLKDLLENKDFPLSSKKQKDFQVIMKSMDFKLAASLIDKAIDEKNLTALSAILSEFYEKYNRSAKIEHTGPDGKEIGVNLFKVFLPEAGDGDKNTRKASKRKKRAKPSNR